MDIFWPWHVDPLFTVRLIVTALCFVLLYDIKRYLAGQKTVTGLTWLIEKSFDGICAMLTPKGKKDDDG
jgi:hypothetical protein